jgi:hypothetical protein
VALQREINEGLNVVESFNRGSSVIHFANGGDLATNRRDEQELGVLCLRVLAGARAVAALSLQHLTGEVRRWFPPGRFSTPQTRAFSPYLPSQQSTRLTGFSMRLPREDKGA